MPSRTVYIRRKVLDRLIEMSKELGYVENGEIKWHTLLNDLLELAIAMYDLGKIKIRHKKLMIYNS